MGQPHNVIRHPDMPRCVFRLLWDTIKAGNEVFAYVVNLAKNGDHYWVFAHVTPSFGPGGQITNYHSNRRVPYPDALQAVIPLYGLLLEEERRHGNPRDGLEASSRMLREKYSMGGSDYGQFVFSLSKSTSLEASI